MNQEENQEARPLIGYYPLLYGGQAAKGMPLEWLQQQLREIGEVGHVVACLWMHGNPPRPVFALQRAQAIWEHLQWWCQQVPQQWFTICAALRPDSGYVISLLPDPGRSLERHRAAMLFEHQTLVPADAYRRVLCQPLSFLSFPGGGTFSSFAPQWQQAAQAGAVVDVGFLEADLLSGTAEPDPAKISWLRDIPVGPREPYQEQWLRELGRPSDAPDEQTQE